MKVIGFNFKKISVEKKKEIDSKLTLSTDIKIENIEKGDIDIFKDKSILNFEYIFKINYQPDFAEIFFHGNILVLFDDKKQTETILKEWKDKKISEDVRLPILNSVFARCNLKSLQLEEDLNLPHHLPSPRLTTQPQSQPTQQPIQETNKKTQDSTSKTSKK